MYYVYELKGLCSCCIQHNIFGISECGNLRLVKHRLLKKDDTDIFIKNHPKLFKIEIIENNLTFPEAYTLLHLLN